MKSRTKMISVFLIASIIVSISFAAAQGMFEGGFHNSSPGLLGDLFLGTNRTINQEIQSAIKNDDYSTWKSLIESQLTEDNFNMIVNMSNQTQFKPLDNRTMNWTGNFTIPFPRHFDQGNMTGNWTGNFTMPFPQNFDRGNLTDNGSKDFTSLDHHRHFFR
jgi:hypothetical protein